MHALSIFGLKFHVDRLGTRLLVLPWYASTVSYLPTAAAVSLYHRAMWRSMEKDRSRQPYHYCPTALTLASVMVARHFCFVGVVSTRWQRTFVVDVSA